MRVTAACPEALIEDANHLAMCLAFSEADGETYRTPCGWQDAAGNRYSCVSFEARDEWLTAAQSPLVRPEWDTGVEVKYEDEYGDVVTYIRYIIDMAAAARAQSRVVIGGAAQSDRIVAIIGDSPAVALAELTVLQDGAIDEENGV